MPYLPKVLVIAPTQRDKREIAEVTKHLSIDPIFTDPLPSQSEPSLLPIWINELVSTYKNQKIQAIFGSTDLNTLVASIVATRLGLTTSPPNQIASVMNKFLSRRLQQAAVPMHVPNFKLVDVNTKQFDTSYPVFLKPIHSQLSCLASKIDTEDQLKQALTACKQQLGNLTGRYASICQLLGLHSHSINQSMLMEEYIDGKQITVEGYVQSGLVHILGIVGADFYSNTQSFSDFHYPSSIPIWVQLKSADITKRVIHISRLDNTMFNIEMRYDSKNKTIKIIEINPRMSSQFSDLFKKVDDINTYELQLKLALNEPVHNISHRGNGNYPFARSHVLRTFEDQVICATPTQSEQAQLQSSLPGVNVEVFGHNGEKLSSLLQDSETFRYGIVNIGAENKLESESRLKKALELLTFELAPIDKPSMRPHAAHTKKPD